MENKQVVVLATKVVETEDKRKFNVYFAYRQELVDGEWKDKLTPYTDEKGQPAFKARPIKAHLSEDFVKKIEKMDVQFPLLVTLNPDKKVKNSDGKSVNAFFVTVDTDKTTKKPRLDKHGKQHLILVIRDADEIVNKPRTEYSLDDLDDFE